MRGELALRQTMPGGPTRPGGAVPQLGTQAAQARLDDNICQHYASQGARYATQRLQNPW